MDVLSGQNNSSIGAMIKRGSENPKRDKRTKLCFESSTEERRLKRRAVLDKRSKMLKRFSAEEKTEEKMEAFPSGVENYSRGVSKLVRWKKKWKTIPAGQVVAFVLYMNAEKKIYYSKRKMDEQLATDMFNIVREANAECYDFRPDAIDFTRMLTRYKRKASVTFRTNVDVRSGYLYGNRYLVKSYFTFGQRTVVRGTSHVYQTLDAPLLFYVYPRGSTNNLHSRDKYFPYESFHLYQRIILMPHGCYRIPEGTTYVLFTLKKTEFMLDVVREPYEMPEGIRWVNPLEKPVTVFKSPFDSAVKTPFIADSQRDTFSEYFSMGELGGCEENDSDEDEEERQPPPPEEEEPLPERARIEDAARAFEDCELMPPPPPPPRPVPVENERQQEQQQITLYMFPQLPVVEKNVVVACPEFVKAYQKLKETRYDDPKVCELDRNLSDWNPEPLDLSGSGRGAVENSNAVQDDDRMRNSNAWGSNEESLMRNSNAWGSNEEGSRWVEESDAMDESNEEGSRWVEESDAAKDLNVAGSNDDGSGRVEESDAMDESGQMSDLCEDEELLNRMLGDVPPGQLANLNLQNDNVLDYLLNDDSGVDPNRMNDMMRDLYASMMITS